MSRPLASKTAFVGAATQRGALFGLDARLAVAILAALSVVVGYTGLQQLQQAHYARVYTDLQALAKALGHLQRDLGAFPLHTSTGATPTERLAQLFSSAYVAADFSSHWRGPYLAVSESQLSSGYIYTYALSGATLTYGLADNPSCSTITNLDCTLDLQITDAPLALAHFLNQQIDEAAGGYGGSSVTEASPSTSGRLRWSGPDPVTITMQTEVKRL